MYCYSLAQAHPTIPLRFTSLTVMMVYHKTDNYFTELFKYANFTICQYSKLYYLHGTNCYLKHITNYNWHNSKIVQSPGLYKTYAPTETMHAFFILKNEQQVFHFADVWRFNA